MGVFKNILICTYIVLIVAGLILSLIGFINYLSSDICREDTGIVQFAIGTVGTLLAIQTTVFISDPEHFYKRSKLGVVNTTVCTGMLTLAIVFGNTTATDLFVNPAICLPKPYYAMYITTQAIAVVLLAVSVLYYFPYVIYRMSISASNRHRERRNAQFSEALEDIYNKIYNEEFNIEKFYKKYDDLIRTRVLTGTEISILKDHFKRQAKEDIECSRCKSKIEEETYYVAHPGCDHPFHKECIGASLKCGVCDNLTRPLIIKHMRLDAFDRITPSI